MVSTPTQVAEHDQLPGENQLTSQLPRHGGEYERLLGGGGGWLEAAGESSLWQPRCSASQRGYSWRVPIGEVTQLLFK